MQSTITTRRTCFADVSIGVTHAVNQRVDNQFERLVWQRKQRRKAVLIDGAQQSIEFTAHRWMRAKIAGNHFERRLKHTTENGRYVTRRLVLK